MQSKTHLNCQLDFFFLIQIQIFGVYHVGDGTPLQYSCLENPMDGGAC